MSRQPVERRRSLDFADLGQIMPDVCRLIPAHHTLGNWTLGQICRHLAASFRGSMEGFDLSNHRIKRFFMSKAMLWVALTKGIPRNYLVDGKLTPPADVALTEAVEELDEVIRRYLEFEGRLHPHPLFGRMPRRTWDRVHCIHCAHHLSFAVHS